MALDLTSFDAALKQHYTSDRVENMNYKDNPFLSLVPKFESFGGRNLPIPIIYGNPQGRSATFSSAKANKYSSSIHDFILTRNHDYSLASIDNETIEASKGNANAFLEASTVEIDGAIASAGRSLAISLFRDGSGYLGQVSAEPAEASTTVITMKNLEDIVNIEIGMTLNIHSAKSGGSQRSTDGSDVSWKVTAVDRDAGTFTLDDAYTSSGTIAANDYVFVEGDRGGMLKGLEAWLPFTAPTSGDSFFGVDRSVDVTRLAGIRKTGSDKPIEEALVDLAARIAREGGAPDYCFMNYAKFADLEKSLGSKVQYVDLSVNAEIGFRGMMIHGPRGPIKVVADQNCPSGYAFMLQMNTWKLYSLGKAPRILDSDGSKMLRESDSDSVEVRVGHYSQLGCRAPGFNGVTSI